MSALDSRTFQIVTVIVIVIVVVVLVANVVPVPVPVPVAVFVLVVVAGQRGEGGPVLSSPGPFGVASTNAFVAILDLEYLHADYLNDANTALPQLLLVVAFGSVRADHNFRAALLQNLVKGHRWQLVRAESALANFSKPTGRTNQEALRATTAKSAESIAAAQIQEVSI